jgi:hypothetical protein
VSVRAPERLSARGPASWPVVLVEGNWWARGPARDADAGSGLAPDHPKRGSMRLLLLGRVGKCWAGASSPGSRALPLLVSTPVLTDRSWVCALRRCEGRKWHTLIALTTAGKS